MFCEFKVQHYAAEATRNIASALGVASHSEGAVINIGLKSLLLEILTVIKSWSEYIARRSGMMCSH